jgi:signal transduction histidine kinase
VRLVTCSAELNLIGREKTPWLRRDLCALGASESDLAAIPTCPDLPRVNLLSNAIKFTPAAGSIQVDVHSDADNARFSVRDTGPGISPSDQARIFDRYSQGDEAGQRPGAGLGLYIAKGIVDAHGGRIWVQSVPGRGSTFAFTLPRA